MNDIAELIVQLESSSISDNYLPLNRDQLVNLSMTLEHFSSGLAIGKKEKSSVIVEEKNRDITKYLNLLVCEVRRISGPSLKKLYSSLMLELFISFQNLMKAEEDINALTGAVWSACRQFQTAPVTNSQQVALLLSFITEMMNDAFQEADQLASGITFDGEVIDLDEQDSSYFAKVKSLLKLCVLCVKKAQSLLKNCIENEFWVLESEKLLATSDELSSKIDDFVSTLDIPLQTDDEFLANSLNSIFKICKDLIERLSKSSNDQKWTSLATAQICKLETSITTLNKISR
jgi:Grap2 and cyclin-D-interacting